MRHTVHRRTTVVLEPTSLSMTHPSRRPPVRAPLQHAHAPRPPPAAHDAEWWKVVIGVTALNGPFDQVHITLAGPRASSVLSPALPIKGHVPVWMPRVHKRRIIVLQVYLLEDAVTSTTILLHEETRWGEGGGGGRDKK